MLDLGTVRPGTTLYIPFHTFDSNDPSASVTITGLATTDIEVYKDGSATQRASDAGYSLLDTDGIDFDTTTGIHGISIDLSDNTTANFYEAGSQYWVVIASITVDAATVNFVAATFRIGYEDAILNTTIATLASQTSFTLEEGPADNDALNNFRVLVHDLASDVQICYGTVSDYVGSTRTVTLSADPGIFTMAAGDNVSFFLPNDATVSGTVNANVVQVSGDSVAADNLEADYDGTGYNKANSTIGTTTTNTDMRGTDSAATAAALATVDTNVDAILVDTGTTLPATLATIDTNVDAILVDTGTTLPATLATIDTVVDAIQVVTDQFVFTVAGNVDANIQYINDAQVTGDGNATPWDGA